MSEQLKFVFPAVLLLAAIVLYFSGYIPEATAGAVLAGAALILPGPYAAKTLGDLAPAGVARIALTAVAVVASAWAVLPVYTALQPGAAKYEGQLTDAAKTVSLGETEPGPYILTVEGALPEREGDVTADYKLKVNSGTQTESIEGALWRRFDNVRVGRRGSARTEHKRTFEHHPVQLEKASTEVSLVREGPELQQGLHFKLHKVLVPMGLYWIIAAIIYAAAALLETRYATEKNRSMLTTALAFSFAFAAIFPDQMSQDAVVRPAFGSGVAAGLIGILIGGVVSWVIRKTVGPALRADTSTAVSASA